MSEPLILADIARQFQESCTSDFAQRCQDLDGVIDRIKNGLRDRLTSDDRIVHISEDADPDPRALVASDGGSLRLHYPVGVKL